MSGKQSTVVLPLLWTVPEAPEQEPRLRLVEDFLPPMSEKLFKALVSLVAVFGIVTYMALNMLMDQGAILERQLQSSLRESQIQVESLQSQVTKMSAPKYLEQRATALGMVPMESSVFLRLSDGSVLGKPQVAVARPASQSNPNGGSTAGAAWSTDDAAILVGAGR